MGRKYFISSKDEDREYKRAIQTGLPADMIDKSLNTLIDSYDTDYVLRVIRKDYLSDSTVTIHLIGSYSSEDLGAYEQRFIKRELQASLYDGEGNSRNGILGVVLPAMESKIYKGSIVCVRCGRTHTVVDVSDATTIREFHSNYYVPNDKCFWTEEDRYCVLVKWDDFSINPEFYIEQAFNKRTEPIATKVRVYP